MAGCAPKRIPGTEIDDTEESQAILAVMEKYRRAMEAKDSDGVLSVVSESFTDNGGTGTPADDLDFKLLREVLPQRLSKVDELRLELSVKKISLAKDEKTAEAIYYYTTTFRLPSLSSRPMTEAGLKKMTFALVGEEWKVTSGI